RARRAEIAAKPGQVWDVLHDGAQRARTLAEETMKEVRAALQLPE
ncbi:MAG: tryptophan--tRNA ligase, partial [Anaerolineae bacterium CG03_land_8_20_14_0_80_58_20]